MGNPLFQMCSESTLDQFWYDKTIPKPTNRVFVACPGTNLKIQKTIPYWGWASSLLSPIEHCPALRGLPEPLPVAWFPFRNTEAHNACSL